MPDDSVSDPHGYEEVDVHGRSATAKAVDIASRLITVSLCLVLPIVGGYFIDQYLGTVAVFIVLGLLFGMLAAGVQLMKLIAPGGVLNPDSATGNKTDQGSDS